MADIPPSSQPRNLCYSDIAIAIDFAETNLSQFGLPFLSTLNESASLACSQGFGFDQLLEVDDLEKRVVMTTAGSGIHPPISFTYQNPNPLVGCVPGKMVAQLFTIVVDAWIGETIMASCSDLLLTRPESGALDLNADGLFTCDEDGTPDDNNSNSVLSCAGVTGVIAPMNDPIPNLTVEIGAVDHSGLPDYGIIPVTCNTTLSGFEYLDFTIRLTVSNLMTDPEIIPGDIVPVTGYPKIYPIPNISDPNMNDFLIYVRYENVSLVPFEDKFFDIQVNAPVFMSEGASVCPSFQIGRLVSNDVCGLAQYDEAMECVVFPGLPVCGETYSINVSGDPLLGIQSNCKLDVLVGFDWSPSDDELYFHTLNLQLDFEAPANVVLESVNLGGALTCPNSNNPAACPGYSNCYSIVNDHTLSICFKQGAPDEFLTLNKDNAYIILTFDAPDNCISDVTLRRAEFGRAIPVPGQPAVIRPVCRLETPDPADPADPYFTKFNFPHCVPFLASEIKNDKAGPEAVEEVDVNISGPCNYDFLTACDGYAACVCSYGDYTVKPSKTDNYLNGLTTYDLVLISKHILGIEPLDSPYKIIAADANGSKSVTSFDNIILRKWILGIIPTNEPPPTNAPDSWSFVDKDYVFQNPSDPWDMNYPQFNESKTVTVTSMSSGEANFVAIKTGDVNLSHVANACRPAARAEARQKFPLLVKRQVENSEEHLTFSVQNSGGSPLEALQSGLRFDPAVMEFVGASIADVPGFSASCLGLGGLTQGEIRLVWLSTDFEQYLWQPGETLCHFTFKVKQGIAREAQLLAADDSILMNEAYTPDNEVFDVDFTRKGLETRTAGAQGTAYLQASCIPNPTGGETSMAIHSPRKEKLRVFLFNAYGARMGYHEVSTTGEPTSVALPEMIQSPAGVYTWLIMAGTQRIAEGRLVKQ